MTTAGSNFISGISTFTNSTDVVNKSYVDTTFSPLPTQTGNTGKFLTNNGTTLSWDYGSNYQEFTTVGSQTFTVPSYANLLYIEAIGAGGGGGVGSNNSEINVVWRLRSSPLANTAYALSYGAGKYFFGTGSSSVLTSTDSIVWTAISGFPTQVYGTAYGTSPSNIYLACTSNSGTAENSGRLYASTDTYNWVLRTVNITQNNGEILHRIKFLNNIYVCASYGPGLRTSTDTIVWTLRTSAGVTPRGLTYGKGIYVLAGVSGGLSTSTDVIHWTLRTTGFATDNHNNVVFYNNNFLTTGWYRKFAVSTDAISWTFRTVGMSNPNDVTCDVVYANNTYTLVAEGGNIITSTDTISWTLRTSNTTLLLAYIVHNPDKNRYVTVPELNSSIILTSGIDPYMPGGSGSYSSWYVPKSVISSNITVSPGSGGLGASSINTGGSSGGNTTISWTGPAGSYTLTASGAIADGYAGPIAPANQSYFYSTPGISGGELTINQINSFQATAGGNSVQTSSSSGLAGGSISYYGNTVFAAGGTPSSINGSNAVAISGIPYGYGGGGGGTGASTAGNGGNGARGGGGGAGAVNGAVFGNGGKGGDGYVKITWW